MLPLVEDLDVTRLHVQAPTEIVFLCGGPFTPLADVPNTPPKSMRDAFMRVLRHPALGAREIVLAEDFTKLSVFSAHYSDILEFESDLAQITELIILFCESAGSFAELGSFSIEEEIAKRLLVIIRDFYADAGSFITLGPLANLKRKIPFSVFVLEDDEIGMQSGSPETIDIDAFKRAMHEPLVARLGGIREPSTFDATRSGHIIKLIVGLVQDYGALKFDEIKETIPIFGVDVSEERLKAFLLCAKTVGWIVIEAKGFDEYYVAFSGKPAATFTLADGVITKNRRRRRLLIREHWQKTDRNRFRVISKAADEVAGDE